MKHSERKLPFAITVLSAGMLAAGSAWAAGMGEESDAMGTEGAMGSQTEVEGERPTFSELDLDQNGQISMDEAQAVEELATQMDQADTDGDGNISQSEFSAFEVQQGWAEPGEEMQQQEPMTEPGQEEPMTEPGM